MVGPATLFPLFFRLFRCPDKSLRQLLFSHIVHDISALNKKHRDERMNRSLQNFLYSMVNDENETAAKKSLAVLIELHKRQVWTDARSVNVVASACQHSKPRWVGGIVLRTVVNESLVFGGSGGRIRGNERGCKRLASQGGLKKGVG